MLRDMMMMSARAEDEELWVPQSGAATPLQPHPVRSLLPTFLPFSYFAELLAISIEGKLLMPYHSLS